MYCQHRIGLVPVDQDDRPKTKVVIHKATPSFGPPDDNSNAIINT